MTILCLCSIRWDNDEIEKQIAAFQEETIVLPELVKVEHGEITRGEPEASLFKMVIYNDSLECSSCKIMHMEDVKDLYELTEEYPGLPDDKRFHSFLLDRDGHPVFIGNPTANEQLWVLFKEVLANLEANGGVYVEPEKR